MFTTSAEKTVIATAHPEWDEKELMDETTVQLLARLQQHQTAENSALYTLMTDFVRITSLTHTECSLVN